MPGRTKSSPLVGEHVDVCWNVKSKTWSVRNVATRLVIGHVKYIALLNATFVVSVEQRDRMIRKGRTTRWASVQGYVFEPDDGQWPKRDMAKHPDLVEVVTYLHGPATFMTVDNHAVTKASAAYMTTRTKPGQVFCSLDYKD